MGSVHFRMHCSRNAALFDDCRLVEIVVVFVSRDHYRPPLPPGVFYYPRRGGESLGLAGNVDVRSVFAGKSRHTCVTQQFRAPFVTSGAVPLVTGWSVTAPANQRRVFRYRLLSGTDPLDPQGPPVRARLPFRGTHCGPSHGGWWSSRILRSGRAWLRRRGLVLRHEAAGCEVCFAPGASTPSVPEGGRDRGRGSCLLSCACSLPWGGGADSESRQSRSNTRPHAGVPASVLCLPSQSRPWQRASNPGSDVPPLPCHPLQSFPWGSPLWSFPRGHQPRGTYGGPMETPTFPAWGPLRLGAWTSSGTPSMA